MVLGKRLLRWYKTAGLGLGFIAIYFLLRLTNITSMPIFTDEAIYIRWSQIGARDAAWRFISLVDGKQPLFTWIMMVLLRVMHGDPLFIGRLVSVIAGFGSLVGIWVLAYELFQSKRIAFFSSFIYLVSPFSLIYDRMALYDSLVATLSIWNLFMAIRLVRYPRLDNALLFGMTLALGMLNKTSGFLSAYLVPLTLFVFSWEKRERWLRFFRWAILCIVSFVLSQLLYSILRLSPLFHMIGQKDLVFVYSLSEWFKFTTLFLDGNLRGLFDWLRGYLTLPLCVVLGIPLYLWRRQTNEKILLYSWWFVPFVGLDLFCL